MQGFNGDDIMLGIGSFDKFEGRLGFDWASYEQATEGVDADLTRREFIAANGAVDTSATSSSRSRASAARRTTTS